MPFIKNTSKINMNNQEQLGIHAVINNASNRYRELCLENGNLIEWFSVESLNWDVKDMKQYISNYIYKDRIRLLISHNRNVRGKVGNISHEFDKQICFIVKCKINQNSDNVLWSDSYEGYSALVETNIDRLEQIILDVLVDISVLYKVLYKEGLISIIGNRYRLNTLCMKRTSSAKKVVAKRMNIEDDNNLIYHPCSSYFRKDDNRYDLEQLYQFWVLVLFYMGKQLENIPQIYNVNDLISIIQSGEKHGGINLQRLTNKFKQKCNNSGYYVYVRLKKSLIGLSDQRRRRIKIILGGKGTTINDCAFIPLVNIHQIRQMEDMFDSLIFKYL